MLRSLDIPNCCLCDRAVLFWPMLRGEYGISLTGDYPLDVVSQNPTLIAFQLPAMWAIPPPGVSFSTGYW